MTRRRECRPRLSPRGIADKMRRESEHRQDARDAQAARTTQRRDYTGRAVHMVGWSSEDLAKWDAEQARAKQIMKARASWESCPVCTTQCSENECKEGCVLEKEKTVTSPPRILGLPPRAWMITIIGGVAAAILALTLSHSWGSKPKPLTDQQAINECLGYGPIKREDFDLRSEADHLRINHMSDVCNQAMKALSMRTVK